MNRFLKVFLLICCITVVFISVSNINVSSRKGVDSQLYTIRMPLYLKVLDFLDRHFNYQLLVNSIITDKQSDEARVLSVFEWTHNNIKKMPEGLPVVDDHVWHIIIRGYGQSDQSCDVFTTLCNYAGIKAFYLLLNLPDSKKRVPLAFVLLSRKWYVFDPYNGVYFINSEGDLVDLEFMKSKKDWQMKLLNQSVHKHIDYETCLENIPELSNSVLYRANIQSPLNRLRFELKKWIK